MTQGFIESFIVVQIATAGKNLPSPSSLQLQTQLQSSPTPTPNFLSPNYTPSSSPNSTSTTRPKSKCAPSFVKAEDTLFFKCFLLLGLSPSKAGAQKASAVFVWLVDVTRSWALRLVNAACSFNSSWCGQDEEASGGDTHQSLEEIPKVARPLHPTRRLRKRAMAVEDREAGEFACMDCNGVGGHLIYQMCY